MIEIRNLSFGYASPTEIYHGFDWAAEDGAAWAVLGPSGCGKTTLVYLLAGLRRPAAGSILVGGAEVTSPRHSTGLILQDYGLLPWARAADNVALGLKLRGVAAKERDATVRHWMERLGIDAVARGYPGQLSGGQRQRVAIARSLALNPSLLLMDEPFSSLDSSTREDLQELVATLSEGTGMATVLVTHDIQEAVFMGRRIMIVGRPPIGSYAVVDNPEARTPGYRQSPAYFERCARVRTLATELAGPGASHRAEPETGTEPQRRGARRAPSRAADPDVSASGDLGGQVAPVGMPPEPTHADRVGVTARPARERDDLGAAR